MANKIVFLFGAGASNGAIRVDPYCPPLMRELYDELAKCYPNEWGLTSRLSPHADQFRDNFEATFSEVVLKIPKDSAPPFMVDSLTLLEKQRLLAKYFSQFVLHSNGMDLYTKLLISLSNAGQILDCLIATLNYDCLVEQAADRIGLRVDYLCTERKSVRVAKLHGSCNFITKRLSQHGRAMLASSGLHYEIDVDFLPAVNVKDALSQRLCGPQVEYLPVMSQVSPGKEHFVAPGKIQQIRNAWSGALSTTTTLVIIGVAHNRNDRHVVEPIRQTRAKIFYVGDNCNFIKWQAENKAFEHVEQKFEHGFKGIIQRLGIG